MLTDQVSDRRLLPPPAAPHPPAPPGRGGPPSSWAEGPAEGLASVGGGRGGPGVGPAACPPFPPRQVRDRVLMGPAGSALRKEGVPWGSGRCFPCPFSPSLTADLRASQTEGERDVHGVGRSGWGRTPPQALQALQDQLWPLTLKETRLACPSNAVAVRLPSSDGAANETTGFLMAAASLCQPPVPASQRRWTLGNVSTRSVGSRSSSSGSRSRPGSAPVMRAGGLTGRGLEAVGTFTRQLGLGPRPPPDGMANPGFCFFHVPAPLARLPGTL